MEIHRQIGFVPSAGDAQPFEFLTLDIDPTFGKAAAFLAEIDNVDLVLVLALGAVSLFDLPFDGQAVAIPAGDIARVKARHLLGAHDHILEDLVQRMANVQMPVRIGGAIMQGEGLARSIAGLFAQAVVNPDLFPAGKPARLALGQARAHRKFGLG